MDDNEKNQKFLSQIRTSFEAGSISKEDFVKAFEEVLRLVVKIENDLIKKIDSKVGTESTTLSEMRQQMEEAIQGVKQANESTLAQMKQRAMESMQAMFTKMGVEKKMKQMSAEHKEMMAQCEMEMEEMKGRETVLDEERVQNSIEGKLRKELPQYGKAFRDGLELLVDNERLDISAIKGIEELEETIKSAVQQKSGTVGWGAHPLMIQQSGTTKTKIAHTLNFTGATITQTAAGVTTIAITGGSGWTVETPTGTVNGTNKTFTVTATPQYIVVDGITYFENDGYTLATLTVTTTVAPVGFIRSIY